MLGVSDLPLLPGLGAGTFGALAALQAGWNLNFLFLLDGDKQGNIERGRYADDFGIRVDRVVTLNELVAGVNVIEDLLDSEAGQIIKGALSLTKAPNKGQIRSFFQERLATDKTEQLGSGFEGNAKAVLNELRSRLGG